MPKYIQTEMWTLSTPQHPRELSRIMERVLRESQSRWMTRSEMAVVAGLNERECRLARQHAKGRIISGQRGYCLTARATMEEQDHAVRVLHSLAKALIQEVVELERVIHRRRTHQPDPQEQENENDSKQ